MTVVTERDVMVNRVGEYKLPGRRLTWQTGSAGGVKQSMNRAGCSDQIAICIHIYGLASV